MNMVWLRTGDTKSQVKLVGKDEKAFSWLRQFVEWHKDLI